MTRTVAEKMGIKQGTRSYLVQASATILAGMNLPALDTPESLHGEFGYIHLFVKTQEDLDQQFPTMKAHLSARGMLWVSWPKSRKLGTDLTLQTIIDIGYSHGLVESTTLSVNETWSAIKFTHPKPGKHIRTVTEPYLLLDVLSHSWLDSTAYRYVSGAL